MARGLLREIKSRYKSSRYFLSRMIDFPCVRPDFMQINLTTRCNLQCRICTVHKSFSDINQELNADEIKEIALQGSRLGLKRIVFSRGEPFLRADIFEIIRFIKENTKMEVVITTNGTLIDLELAKKIIQAEVNHLQISLDGATERTHDLIRDKGSFVKITQAIEILNGIKSRKLSLGLSFTVIKLNYKEMRSFLDLGRSLGVDNILFIPFIEDNSYKHEKNIANKAIFNEQESEEFNLILEEIKNFQKTHDSPVISNLDNLFLYKEYFSGTLDNLHWNCYAGFHWIQVNPNGVMRMCEWEYGNIKENNLRKIWYSPKARKARGMIKKCRRLCLQPCMSRPS